ncbi:MAG: hypothetical protein JJE04_11390, partial [Acidobacteriia bacterium]|nr:hypothetical protein [Terriglobia bacterium]
MSARVFVPFLILGLAAGAEPRITYSKSFPGSVPAFVVITLERGGKGVYKESADDSQPLKFSLKQTEADEIFALAEKLDHFKRPLESGLKVAFMGTKAFQWQDGAPGAEVKFNYSLDADAKAITDWFERMSETEQHYIAVERSVKFDKLGAHKALLQMHAAMERNRLVALDQFLPLLDRVVKNDSYLNMARERA